MIEWFRRAHLTSLRHARSHLMTLVASYFLMLRMIEADAKSRREFRRPGVTAQLMTSAARRDIAAAGLRARCVTAIASGMRVEASRDRKCHAPTRRLMTGGATHATHIHVTRVIKPHPETPQTRKSPGGAGFNVGVTDGAHRAV